MKKFFLFLFILMFGVVANGYALPLWDDAQPINTGGIDYTIVDRVGGWDDTPTPNPNYDGTYFGYSGVTWTGYYLGTITDPANDSGGGANFITPIIEYYLGAAFLLTGIDKVDVPDGSNSGSDTNGDLTVTWDANHLSGTWSVTGTDEVSFYTVKAATEWALYYVDPSQLNGIWTTEHLLTPNGRNIPGISHLSAVMTDPGDPPPPQNPIPEPTTMLLLGTGLVGFAGMSRKKYKK